MPKVKIEVRGYGTIEAHVGSNLGEVLAKHNVIVLPCGGRGLCRQCLVRVYGDTNPLTAIEKLYGLEPPYRLACQVVVLSDLVVELVKRPHFTASMNSIHIELKSFKPICRVVKVSRYPITSDKPVYASIAKKIADCSSIVVIEGIGMCGCVEDCDSYNIALIDMGTTKIGYRVVDLRGEIVEEYVELNPQNIYGFDIVSRITKALESREAFEDLHRRLHSSVESFVKSRRCIALGLVAGNSAMLSFFLGLPIDTLASKPFQPKIKSLIYTSIDNTTIVTLPPIAGFVGSDIVSDIIAIEYLKPRVPYLIIDIGTNTEIALVKERDPLEVYVASAPAGPAIEGVVEHSSSIVFGGIRKVRLRNVGEVVEFEYEGEPIGFLGSGIISLVAELVRHGLVDRSGRFVKGYRSLNKGKAFVIAQNIVFTQRDLREVQKALAAIKSGWRVILEEAGIDVHNLEAVYVAGSFGTSIDLEDLALLKLVPIDEISKAAFIGNAVLEGLRIVALNKDYLSLALEIVKKAKHIDLATHPRFKHLWIDSLSLY